MKRKPKIKTNIQLVTDIMNNSEHGALAQLFVIDALIKQSKAVGKSKPSDYPEGCFIYPPSWIAVAKEISQKLEVKP
jgi:hypothetical protein